MSLRFSKMHGIGNDFVIVDARSQPFALGEAEIRRLADRHVGVGFDQLLSIDPARDPSCAFAYAIWNADGTPSGQCGNGLRCVASWLARDGALGAGATRLQSPSGPVAVELLGGGHVRADMGEPEFEPAAIPLRVGARATDAERHEHRIDVAGSEMRIGAVSMGNPHAVLVVDDIALAPVESLGAQIEHSDAFPQGCNVGFVHVSTRGQVRLRVWERGVGETLACGSGAAAAMAVLRLRGQVDDAVAVRLPGGTLDIAWAGPGSHLWMSGPTAFVFEGEWHG